MTDSDKIHKNLKPQSRAPSSSTPFEYEAMTEEEQVGHAVRMMGMQEGESVSG